MTHRLSLYLRIASNKTRWFGAKIAVCVLFITLSANESGYSATGRTETNHIIRIAGLLFNIPPAAGLQYQKNEISGAETLLLLIPVSSLDMELSRVQGRVIDHITTTIITGEDYAALLASYERATHNHVKDSLGDYKIYDYGSDEQLFVADGNIEPNFFYATTILKSHFYLLELISAISQKKSMTVYTSLMLEIKRFYYIIKLIEMIC